MNEEQKQWIEKLKAIINEPVADTVESYESLVGNVQQHVDVSPEP